MLWVCHNNYSIIQYASKGHEDLNLNPIKYQITWQASFFINSNDGFSFYSYRMHWDCIICYGSTVYEELGFSRQKYHP